MYTVSQRGENQQRLVRERRLNACAVPESCRERSREDRSRCCRLIDRIDRFAQRTPGARLNDSVTDGNCPW